MESPVFQLAKPSWLSYPDPWRGLHLSSCSGPANRHLVYTEPLVCFVGTVVFLVEKWVI